MTKELGWCWTTIYSRAGKHLGTPCTFKMTYLRRDLSVRAETPSGRRWGSSDPERRRLHYVQNRNSSSKVTASRELIRPIPVLKWLLSESSFGKFLYIKQKCSKFIYSIRIFYRPICCGIHGSYCTHSTSRTNGTFSTFVILAVMAVMTLIAHRGDFLFSFIQD